jgi:hypothetical protein
MKFIWKTKDYYDFLVWKYGVDDKIVFDRTNKEWRYYTEIPVWRLSCLAILWKLYTVLRFDEKTFYYGDDITMDLVKESHNKSYDVFNITLFNKILSLNWKTTTLNIDNNCPYGIVDFNFSSYYENYQFDKFDIIDYKWYKYKLFLLKWVVNLSGYWIPKIIPAEDLYLGIYDFFTQVKDIPNNQTDIEKVISHWLDPKYWFRKRKI